MFSIILDILANILSIISSVHGMRMISIPEKEYVKGKENKALHNEPKLSFWGGAFFSRYHFSTAQKAAEEIAKKIEDSDDGRPNLIIGIGRGGAIFGAMLSYRLENTTLQYAERTYSWEPITNDRKEGFIVPSMFPEYFKGNVLVVAGEYHTGKTMEHYCNYLRSHNIDKIRTCAFYVEKGASSKRPDYYGKERKGCPLMPWQDADTIRDSISAKDAELLKKKNCEHHRRIFVVRHGETDENRNEVFIGSSDVQLSASGKRQAEQAGELIQKLLIPGSSPKVFYSPMNRTRETASIILEQLSDNRVSLTPVSSLVERDYGVWEMKSRDDIRQEFPELYDQYERDPMHCTPKSATPMDEIVKRAESVLKLLDKNYDQNVILITHKTTGRVILSKLLGLPLDNYRSIPFMNGQVVVLDSIDKQIKDISNRSQS